MMKLTERQREMLQSIAENDGPVDYAEFADRGGSALGWRNRERVISALAARDLIDDDLQITDAGRAALEASQ